MTKLDWAREEIAYLKFWLGAVVFIDISLVGWLLASAGAAPLYKSVGALLTMSMVSFAGYALHRRIQSV